MNNKNILLGQIAICGFAIFFLYSLSFASNRSAELESTIILSDNPHDQRINGSTVNKMLDKKDNYMTMAK